MVRLLAVMLILVTAFTAVALMLVTGMPSPKACLVPVLEIGERVVWLLPFFMILGFARGGAGGVGRRVCLSVVRWVRMVSQVLQTENRAFLFIEWPHATWLSDAVNLTMTFWVMVALYVPVMSIVRALADTWPLNLALGIAILLLFGAHRLPGQEDAEGHESGSRPLPSVLTGLLQVVLLAAALGVYGVLTLELLLGALHAGSQPAQACANHPGC
jgi:hypothetical protein